jgi:oxygen-independent coproporphyrinogen-3 oxidase
MVFYKNYSNYFDYEFEDVIKLFFLPQELTKVDGPWDKFSGAFILCELIEAEEQEQLMLRVNYKDFDETEYLSITCQKNSDKDSTKKLRRKFKRILFKLLTNATGKTIPWGIMTGIRPAKLVNEFIDKGIGREEIMTKLKDDYYVARDKAVLLCEVAENQRKLFLNSNENSISMYVGIPFCPTRCLYCSFSSSTTAQYKKVIDLYVDTLLKEIKHTAKLIADNNFKIESIYIGGGTPTSLEAHQLSNLLEGMEEYLNYDTLKEYTIEAGRPDTINSDKLSVIKNSSVTRISINPQTMNADTLERIGRKHSPEDIERAYYMARSMGFDNINMDLICGLPGEDADMFAATLEKIRALAPDSLTVHTMAIKRASRLTEEMESYNLAIEYQQVSQMVNMARKFAEEIELFPYYLYRQKNILGNLENIGYSRKNKECLYNIQIMEERQSILACGAGAASKFVYPGNRIERAFNVKSVEEYIGRIDEMIERKFALISK